MDELFDANVEALTQNEDDLSSAIWIRSYRQDGGCKIMGFRAETFGYTNLLSVYRGEIYFISHMVEDGSDVYILRILLLSQ